MAAALPQADDLDITPLSHGEQIILQFVWHNEQEFGPDIAL
jgi:hypothetical protein